MKLLIKEIVLSKSDIEAVIQLVFVEKVLPMEIHPCLVAVYGENAMSVQMIHKWY